MATKKPVAKSKGSSKSSVKSKPAGKAVKVESSEKVAPTTASKSGSARSTGSKPIPVVGIIDSESLEMNNDHMIAEKKSPKAKSATKAESKEKKSARVRLADKQMAEPVKERRFTFNLKSFKKSVGEFTNEEKLQALFQLQLIDSEIDRIRIMRGELPMEVLDLEDEIAGLQTRIGNLNEEVQEMQNQITAKKQTIKEATAAIKKYESQQMNVKNNREFDSLNKEIEFQQLEIQLADKRIREFSLALDERKAVQEESSKVLEDRLGDLKTKKDELDTIIAETQREEEQLLKFADQARAMVEERLVTAYDRIRKNARNGLAVVTIQRDACGGCFNKIPPQRQLDIRQHKKVIVCEHCGRILVDHDIEL